MTVTTVYSILILLSILTVIQNIVAKTIHIPEPDVYTGSYN